MAIYTLCSLALPIYAKSNSIKDEPIKSDLANSFFTIYKDYISPVDGDRCVMYPSCSNYGKQAVKKHGFFIGWIMVCDRLIRCGRDEVKISKSIKEPNARLLTLDPLESNDFWWYSYEPSR
ncbi:MAG: membrane protein insertion efficiency factor YidD [Desulfamplus sp.]|nr:membrane protein insertion efficiency factor YidD [Desulfamplus sp.]MBF0388875.1 membrane protein insertion efficiency factor YidD [Desulfamplus sp.]